MILDVILILIIALGTFIGYKKGFVKVVIKLGITVVAIVLGLLFHESVSNFIGDTLGLRSSITVAVQNKLTDFTKNNEDTLEINIPVLGNTIKDIKEAKEDKKSEIIDKWAEKITSFIIKGLSFIAIFLVSAITMGIISLVLDTVVKLPVLSTLNGALGATFEFVLISFVICIILAVVSFVSPLGILPVVTDYIEETRIIKWIYENNIIVSIIGKGLLK